MFESFVVMLREGIEAALIIGIILVVLRRSNQRNLERPVYTGLCLAILASVGVAVAMRFLPVSDALYEGSLYLISAAFVVTMMWWMHRNAKTLGVDIRERVQHAVAASRLRSRKAAWGLGAFAFLMVFREGAEAVLFLSAVNLTTDAVLGFIGSMLGLIVAIVFAVMFVRGSLHVNLQRFFVVTECVLAIFVAQLIINGYHEFSEAGVFPATQRSMALVGPVVRNNSLFILAIVAIPLFIWLTGAKRTLQTTADTTAAERRLTLARARRERFYRGGAIATTLIVLAAIGAVYAREVMPRTLPAPEMIMADGDVVSVPLSRVDDGALHRLGVVVGGKTVRFLALRAADGKIHTGLDACAICGAFGYTEQDKTLMCRNCSAAINPLTVGVAGGCNPIALESEVRSGLLRIRVAALEASAHLFSASAQTGDTEVDPVCGMRVKFSDATAIATVNGKTHYFCSQKCRDLFDKNNDVR